MKILLLGFLGSGRTSVGQLLAQALNYTLVELDEEVRKKTGATSVNDGYDKSVIAWKEAELAVCKELSQRDNLIIAGSGGMVENDLNILYFKEHAKKLLVVYLKTRPEVLTERLVAGFEEFIPIWDQNP